MYMREWIGDKQNSDDIRLINHFNITCSILLPVFPLQDCPSILVELESDDDDVAWMDADWGRSAIRFIPLHTVNVNNPFLSVNLHDLALTTLVLSSNDANFIIFSDG